MKTAKSGQTLTDPFFSKKIAYSSFSLDTAVSSPVARIVDAVTAGFNTDEELQELQDFYDDNFAIVRFKKVSYKTHLFPNRFEFFISQLGTAERATETALETVEANVAWMADHYDEVETWLDENTGKRF